MKTNYVNFCIVKIGLLLGIFIFSGTFNATDIIKITNKSLKRGYATRITCVTDELYTRTISIEYGKTGTFKKTPIVGGEFSGIECQGEFDGRRTSGGYYFYPKAEEKNINLVATYNPDTVAIKLEKQK